MIDFKLLRISVGLMLVSLFYSCEEVIFSEDISEDTIMVIAPVDGAEVNALTINFNWEDLEGATDYQVQVAESSFEQANQIILDTIINQTSFSSEIPVGNYQWRIRGQNNNYQTNYSIQDLTVTQD